MPCVLASLSPPPRRRGLRSVRTKQRLQRLEIEIFLQLVQDLLGDLAVCAFDHAPRSAAISWPRSR